MRLCGLGKLQRATRWARNRLTPGGLILHYHRVTELPSDPFNLCVTPRHFAEQLEVLKQHSHTIPLQQLVQAVREGKHPNRAIAITFDDGYADNLYEAKPLLERYDIPTTIFVATGNLGNEREFWSDELDRLLLQPGTLPTTLRLSINSRTYHWDLGEAADYSESDYQRYRSWSWYVPEPADPGPRQRLYRSLYQLLHPLFTDERQKLLDELLTWSGAQALSRSTHRFLSPTEVSALKQEGLIEIGAHTVTHPFLSKLPAALQWQEIQQSKSHLEALIEHPVNSFAYPHGDYTAKTTDLIREAGFTCACSTSANRVWRNTDCFQLPRLEVQDWDGEEFARHLSKWFQA